MKEKRRFCLLVFWIIYLIPFCVKSQNTDGNTEVKFIPGQPTLESGFKLNFDFVDPAYVEIESGTEFANLYVLSEDQNNLRQSVWLVVPKADGKFSLSSMNHQNMEKGKWEKKNILISDTSSYTYPIKIKWGFTDEKLVYKWIGSGTENIPKAVKKEEKLNAGDTLPDFKVELLDGGIINTSDLNGKILAINWWATTCAPCIAEIPGLNKLADKYADKDDIIFLAIAWNEPEELVQFLAEREFNYTHALYNDATIEIFGGAFPRNVIVDKQGKISYNELGANKDKWKQLDEVIQLLQKTE